jgi:hypothetical protein
MITKESTDKAQLTTGQSTVNPDQLAKYLDTTVDHVLHLIKYKFACGCTNDAETERPYCELWSAQMQYDKAKTHLDITMQQHEAKMNAARNALRLGPESG